MANIADLSNALGQVQGKLDLVIAALNKLDSDSSASRGAMRSDIADMRTRVENVERVIEEMEPIVMRLRDDRMKTIGFLTAISLGGGAVGAKALAFLKYWGG